MGCFVHLVHVMGFIPPYSNKGLYISPTPSSVLHPTPCVCVCACAIVCVCDCVCVCVHCVCRGGCTYVCVLVNLACFTATLVRCGP